MPFAYVLAQVELTDPVAFDAYKRKVPESIAKYGGEFLVRGGRYQCLEGNEPLPRLVVLRFPSYERALTWYHSEEYARLKDVRLAGARGTLILVEGVASTEDALPA